MKSLLKYSILLIWVSYLSLNASQFTEFGSLIGDGIKRTTYSYGGSATYSPTSYAYGSSFHYFSGNPPTVPAWTEYYDVVRFYEYNLNFLPSDAYNVTVKIEAYRSGGSGTSELVKTSDYVFPNDAAMFSAVLGGSKLFTVDNSSGTWHDITSSVSSNIAARGKVNFGVRSDGTYYGYVTVYILVEWDAPCHITAQNNFAGGTIKVGVNSSATNRTSPYSFSANIGSTVNLQAVEQSNSGYNMVWNDTEDPLNQSNWVRSGVHKSYNQTYSFSASTEDRDKIYTANLKKICNVDFENSTGAGSIKLNGTTYSSPAPRKYIVEDTDISAQALIHQSGGIDFTFVNWSEEGGNNLSFTFYPTSHKVYTANFEGTPNNTYRNQRFNSKVVGQPIKVYWDQHPNTNVTQYKVYRKPKYGSESCVGTFARTGNSSYVYTFTDPDMVHTNSSSSNDLYYYDVRAYYSPDGTYSDYDFKAVYAEMGGPIANDNPNEERMQIAEKIYEYGISNYPNPYNPTTTISYQIKEMGNVNITVFDALGRTVKVLVNDIKQPGVYNILFDGSNLSNGVYYYRMQAGNFVETKKMIMMK